MFGLETISKLAAVPNPSFPRRRESKPPLFYIYNRMAALNAF